MSITFSNRSKEAFALAIDLHKNQKRKIANGESEKLAIPYITHLLNVASNVLQAGGNEKKFGRKALELVLAATDGEPN